MPHVLVGAGGWQYFNISGDRLKNYARVFKTVEVNSTFYRIPPLDIAENWRRRVPDDFEFTVRCNRELTHNNQFENLDYSIKVLEQMKHICITLKAQILHLETPPTFIIDSIKLEKIDNFLSIIDLSTINLSWEIRSQIKDENQKLLKILEKHNVIHCVDFSKENPAYENNIIYSRLFGKGIYNAYQFTNDELQEIDRKITNSCADKAYLNFHGRRMYKDAVRINIFEATGHFPKITNGVGVDSVIEVLREDAQFPTTTSKLIKTQGWRVCEWGENQQLHLLDILTKLEDKTFKNIEELRTKLKKL